MGFVSRLLYRLRENAEVRNVISKIKPLGVWEEIEKLKIKNEELMYRFKQISNTVSDRETTNPITENLFPPEENLLDTNWGTYVEPTSTPAYLGTVIDGINGMKVTRVAEETAFGIGDVVNKRHAYSKRGAWNSDGTLIALSNDAKILDGSTYALLGTCVGFGSLGWFNTEPHKVYQSSSSDNFFRIQTFNPTTYAISTLFNKVFSDYTIMSHGGNEGNVSADDKTAALFGYKPATGTDTWVVIYDIELDSIVSETNIGTAYSDIDWLTICQSGTRFVVQYNTDGVAINQGTHSYDRNGANRIQLTTTTGHGDLGIDQAGADVFVSYDLNGIYRLSSIDLITGVSTGLFPNTNGEVSGGHISCRNLKRPGWAYVSSGYNITTAAQEEVFAIKLDNSNTIERWCKHNTALHNTKYYHQPHAVPNQEGTKVIFASDWHDAGLEAKTYAPSFVVEKDI